MKSEKPAPDKPTQSTAADFLAELPDLTKTTRAEPGSTATPGVKMRDLFALAKKHSHMTIEEIDQLLTSPVYTHRLGAVSIMDWKARAKTTAEVTRKALFDLYLSRHHWINDWSLVDRAAPYVIGGYLYDKPREILYQLARSPNLWERRTAITSTYYFIRQHEVQTTFEIGAILSDDADYFVQTAVGGWLREAGKQQEQQLIHFLDRYAPIMPSVMLRFAVEHLSQAQRERYRKGKNSRHQVPA